MNYKKCWSAYLNQTGKNVATMILSYCSNSASTLIIIPAQRQTACLLPLQSDGLLMGVAGACTRMEQEVTWDGHVSAGPHHFAEWADEDAEAHDAHDHANDACVRGERDEDNADRH